MTRVRDSARARAASWSCVVWRRRPSVPISELHDRQPQPRDCTRAFPEIRSWPRSSRRGSRPPWIEPCTYSFFLILNSAHAVVRDAFISLNRPRYRCSLCSWYWSPRPSLKVLSIVVWEVFSVLDQTDNRENMNSHLILPPLLVDLKVQVRISARPA